MVGARLRGILDELFSSANSTEELINELTFDRGYPDSVAERIAYGELDMRPGAIAERRQDFAPNMETFYHGGAPDIGDFGGKNERGFDRDPTFVSDSPMLANTYVTQPGAGVYGARQGQIYPVAVDTRNFMYTSARGQEWGDMKGLNVYDPNQNLYVVQDGTPFYSKYDRSFDTDDLSELAMGEEAPGIIIDDVVDIGPNFRAAKKAYRGNKDLYQDFLDLERGSKVMSVNDPSRIRSLFGAAFDPEYKGSNILGGAATAAVGAGLLAAPEEAEAGPVKTAKDLLFLHNTTADKLARQSAMGGMPNPSIAVTQQDVPFTGFGDISLVGKPEAFDPKLRSNPLYSADAYTVRAPSPVRVANKGAYKQFSSDFAPYRDAGNIDDVAYSLADLETKTRLEPSDFRRVNDFLEYDNAAALKFADDVGIKLSNKDYHEISQMKANNADKYQEWKDGVLNDYFQGEEFFVTNPDFDRYAGRANLKPYTADNVSRYMTRQAGANKESTMTFGAGNIRASTAERISSLPKAREMKGLLQPADAVAEVKETASMMLGDLQTALRDYYKYDASSFRYFDEVGEMIALSERKGMKRAMEEIGFEDVPDSLVKEIEEYKDYLRSAPTEYFESKPQRAVQLTDFAGAIIPENTSSRRA